MKSPSAAASWPDSRGGFIPSTHPPAPSKIMRPVWLYGTMEQRGLQEAAGTCLTEIAAAMNQAPERTSTSSLHKYPWAQSFAFPHRSPSWGMLLGSWEKCSEVWGMGEELETFPCPSHRTQKKKGGPGWLLEEKGKGFSEQVFAGQSLPKGQ